MPSNGTLKVQGLVQPCLEIDGRQGETDSLRHHRGADSHRPGCERPARSRKRSGLRRPQRSATLRAGIRGPPDTRPVGKSGRAFRASRQSWSGAPMLPTGESRLAHKTTPPRPRRLANPDEPCAAGKQTRSDCRPRSVRRLCSRTCMQSPHPCRLRGRSQAGRLPDRLSHPTRPGGNLLTRSPARERHFSSSPSLVCLPHPALDNPSQRSPNASWQGVDRSKVPIAPSYH